MATFNQLLIANGIEPRDVALLRHQTKRRGRTPNWLWENDRAGFFLYQSTQQDLPIFRKPYWASFVSPAQHETMFVCLFQVEARPEVEIDWVDQLSGGLVGEGKDAPYFYYECSLSPLMSEHIGSLRIGWGESLRQWTQYAANDDKRIVGGIPARPADRLEPEGSRAAGLQRTLALLGFDPLHRTKKITMLRDDEGVTIYLKNETSRFPVVIHPYYDTIRNRLGEILGIVVDPERPFYVNSNLSSFPIYRAPHRETSSRYGIALDTDDAASIANLVALLRGNRTIETPLGDVSFSNREDRKGPTEREALCLARIGQGQFRLDCNQIWHWRCAVSAIGVQEMLRASHIKPWSEATNAERLDPYNGLLLAAHLDALFDKHLVTFDDDGALIFSSRIPELEIAKIGIDATRMRISSLHDRHRKYLAGHRKRFRSLEQS